MANTYGSTPTAFTFPGVDHVYFTSLRQLRELIKPISSFTRPSTFGEATARIKHNLSYFHSTYAMFVLLIIYLSLFLHPDLLIIYFSIVYSVLLLLYFCHEGQFVVVFTLTVNDRIVLGVLGVFDRIVLGVLGVFTFLFFLPSGVWLNVLVSILIGFAIVVIHATFRGTEDLYLDLQQVDGNEDLVSDLQEVEGNEDLLSDLQEVDGNEDDGGILPISLIASEP